MTKLMVDLKSKEDLNIVQIDAFIINTEEYSCFNDTCFKITEVMTLATELHSVGKTVIVNIDRILEEAELESCYYNLDMLNHEIIDYYIYSDFAILAYFSEKKLTKKLIYDAKTMITNQYDAEFYKELGTMVMVSNELTPSQFKTLSGVGNVCVEVYGYHQIFYSRRSLLANYQAFIQVEQVLQDKLFYLKEELREEKYLIFESKHGTFVYTNYIYCALQEIVDSLLNFKFIKINTMFLKAEEVALVVQVYHDLIEGNYRDITDLYQRLRNVHSNSSNGYLSREVAVEKEESK